MALRKIIVATLTVLAAATTAHAQLLWKVTSPKSNSTSYIFGTHHIAPVTVLDSVPGFAKALASVEKVYGEIIMAKIQTPETNALMQKYMVAPADSTLSKLLTTAQLDSLETVMQKYAGPMVTLSMLEQFTPATVATQLALLQASKAFPSFNPTQQLDTEVQSRATAAGKEVDGLESIELQLKKLYGAPLSKQAADLMLSVRNDAEYAKRAIELSHAYRAGNLKRMFEIMTDPESGMDDDTADNMIYSRNDAWVDFLIGALPSASILIVVGAGHLPGERGLINQLRNRGFSVVPADSTENI